MFNVEQIEDLPPHYTAKASPRMNLGQRIEHAEGLFAATGADIRSGGKRAFYASQPDFVQMPEFESFKSTTSQIHTNASPRTDHAASAARTNCVSAPESNVLPKRRQRPLRKRNSTGVGSDRLGARSGMAGTQGSGATFKGIKSAPSSGDQSPFFFRSCRQA
ncbi:zincin-like metallopeptidase domain-containing protein [Rhodobacteraceae bacterium KMM 6894]|nr:zincin-like metallopeptidase domain-containing protein [Rhodobacteraceae bacterium KMM 6894]